MVAIGLAAVLTRTGRAGPDVPNQTRSALALPVTFSMLRCGVQSSPAWHPTAPSSLKLSIVRHLTGITDVLASILHQGFDLTMDCPQQYYQACSSDVSDVSCAVDPFSSMPEVGSKAGEVQTNIYRALENHNTFTSVPFKPNSTAPHRTSADAC